MNDNSVGGWQAMANSWVGVFDPARLVSSLSGCVLSSQTWCPNLSTSNSCYKTLPPPLKTGSLHVRLGCQDLKLRRPSASASSLPQGSDLGSNEEPDSSDSDGASVRRVVLSSENLELDSLLPSRKVEPEAEVKPNANPVQSALERAAAYKKLKSKTSPGALTKFASSSPPPSPVAPLKLPKVEIVAGKQFQSNINSPISSPDSPTFSTPEVSSTSSGGIDYESIASVPKLEPPKQLNYELVVEGKSNGCGDEVSATKQGGSYEEVSVAALTAFEKALAYKLQKAEMMDALKKEEKVQEIPAISLIKEEDEKVVEVEIHTREGIIRRKVLKPEIAFANVREFKKTGVSDMDFVGLGFADKKTSTSIPARVGEEYAVPTGALPEVEILTRDAGLQAPTSMEEENGDVYKPRVTTWGVFPRPADISKAYGGGRNIKPGQKLETEEERVARETRTKKMYDDYRKKMGLDIDPKVKAHCERAMKQGETLMDTGRLREALVIFQNVMEDMVFQSELHGQAALQEAVCLDSINRSDEAKVKYEKLVSHPNGAIRKKARQFLFGFKAAEKLKVEGGYNWDGSIYRKYFDSFADGYNTSYKANEEDISTESFIQALPYALFLIFPVVLVFTLAALKSS